jgi:hypothetical protein
MNIFTTPPNVDALFAACVAYLCIAFVVWPWSAGLIDLFFWLVRGHQATHIAWTNPLIAIGLLFAWPMLTGTLLCAIAG